jgi:hypothetical protein
MNKFYVKDGNLVKYFTSVPDVISFLEQVVTLKLKTTRTDWMNHMRDLGHGYDDSLGRMFTESLQNHVEIGSVSSEGKLVRCNIHEATLFEKPEYGD